MGEADKREFGTIVAISKEAKMIPKSFLDNASDQKTSSAAKTSFVRSPVIWP